ncbi:hypothetical protein CDL15_Pgr026761 [Punica granatum]|uniref:Uncharacterized protein n=1 Tax=Punica granatum TaxID=22663 RepID=A0A218WN56_PUNGR|nr:hypothetical protein CDL15_Pgr026761 [Punica granatum]
MERLPIEVIGKIMSHISAARTSLGLQGLAGIGARLSTSTSVSSCSTCVSGIGFANLRQGARSLRIVLDPYIEYLASTVLSWLHHTRNSLRELDYLVHTNPALDVLEILGRQKLEELDLEDIAIEQSLVLIGVEPSGEVKTKPSLSGCDLEDDEHELLLYRLGGYACFANVVQLKVAWSLKGEFMDLIEGLLGCCPCLQKLTVNAEVTGVEDEDRQVLLRFTTAMIKVMRRKIDMDVVLNFHSLVQEEGLA